MHPQAHANNPFMLMLNPELVFAAMESSERLAQLNRHQCRPLDKALPATEAEGSDGDSETTAEH